MSLWVKEKYRGFGASGSRGHPSEKRSNCSAKLVITKKYNNCDNRCGSVHNRHGMSMYGALLVTAFQKLTFGPE